MNEPVRGISDFFGIGNAVRGALEIYFRSARRSGRTTALIEHLQDGDRVVFLNQKHAEHFQRQARQLGKEIEIAVCPVNDLHRIMDRPGSANRLFLDHSWIEEFYLHKMDQAAELLHFIQDHKSAKRDSNSPFAERVRQ